MNDDQRDIEFGRPVPPPRPPAEPPPEPPTGPYPALSGTGAWARPALPPAGEPVAFGDPGSTGVPQEHFPAGESAFGDPGVRVPQEAPPAGETFFGDPGHDDPFGDPQGPSPERTGADGGPVPGRRSRRAARREPAFGGVLQAVGRFAAHRYGTAALILLAAASLYGVAEITRPGPAPAHRGGVVPVEAAVAVCPDAAKAEITVASTGRGDGEAVVRDPVGKVLTTLDAPGTAWTSTRAQTAKRKGPLVVDASGAHAAGLAAVQTTEDRRGLSGARCAAPGTDHWFVTPGPGEGDVELHLANADDVPATVDVHAISDQGSLATTDGKSLEVPGQAARVVRIGRGPDGLGSVAAGTGVIALRVTATTGRVAAAVRTDLGSRGADWVPASAGPARALVLPGVPPGGGRRTLYVGAPGEADARVRIKVVTEDGVFAPEGQDTLEVPADTVMSLDLETSLGGRAAAVVLTSGRELVAGLQAGGEEVSYGAAAAPLGEGSTVAGSQKGSTLLLTAPEAAAVVRVTPLDKAGPGTAQEVRLAAGRTVEVPVDAAAVRVEPLAGSGPVYGARFRVVKSGRSRTATLLVLGPDPASVRLPAVGGSLTAVLTDPGGS
ncbi:DUF5719 family protein [Actinocorallia populi]|uniref:DUF5719 family protein n=1 Tax=Actinocorallia populi TaxID=2079200 RepID=UPI000D097746|nr:DUF5719 family protein [Actinocorallia populi]